MEVKLGYKYLDVKQFLPFILQEIFHRHSGIKAEYGRTRKEMDT